MANKYYEAKEGLNHTAHDLLLRLQKACPGTTADPQEGRIVIHDGEGHTIECVMGIADQRMTLYTSPSEAARLLAVETPDYGTIRGAIEHYLKKSHEYGKLMRMYASQK